MLYTGMPRKVELVVLPIAQAIEANRKDSEVTDAILDVTC
jgi:hypothetical protein